MPKVLTARHREGVTERARQYLKSRLIMPTVPLGMVTLLTGYGSIVWAWVQDTLTPNALLGSTALFVVGAVWGWAHTRYERYLITACPEYLAQKQKLLQAAKEYKRPKGEVAATGPHHPGRKWVVAGYVLGIGTQLGMTVYAIDQVGVYAALFLPWAGYFNAKVIFLRDVLRY